MSEQTLYSSVDGIRRGWVGRPLGQAQLPDSHVEYIYTQLKKIYPDDLQMGDYITYNQFTLDVDTHEELKETLGLSDLPLCLPTLLISNVLKLLKSNGLPIVPELDVVEETTPKYRVVTVGFKNTFDASVSEAKSSIVALTPENRARTKSDLNYIQRELLESLQGMSADDINPFINEKIVDFNSKLRNRVFKDVRDLSITTGDISCLRDNQAGRFWTTTVTIKEPDGLGMESIKFHFYINVGK
jgi:hypothetical protein